MPSHRQEGRWFYECQNFTGDLKKYDDISIVWDRIGDWRVHAGIANDYTEMPFRPTSSIGENDFFGEVDYQITQSGSVCIDPDATAYDYPGYEDVYDEALLFGSLECLDGQDWVFICDKVMLLPRLTI